ncbi:Hypothetical predicted protein [Scomber scombrus]|uniref:Uncharacterized protein n=1 Tax=Scomber scombrus TaxID=13677 RepID=A0AAV1Q9N4_SCOSC
MRKMITLYCQHDEEEEEDEEDVFLEEESQPEPTEETLTELQVQSKLSFIKCEFPLELRGEAFLPPIISLL